MKQLFYIFFIITFSFLFISCEKPDDKAPTVTILTLQENDVVSGIVIISCDATDNDAVEKVELWIQGDYSGISDYSEPYELIWDTSEYNNGTYNIFVRSYDVNDNYSDSETISVIINNIMFSKVYEFGSKSNGRSVCQTNDDGYIITGVTNGTAFLLNTDSQGNEIWRNTYGISINDDYGGWEVQKTSDGGYVLIGTTWDNDGNSIFIVKTNSYGNESWNKLIKKLDSSNGRSIKQTNDGGYILTGYSRYSTNDKTTLIKLNSNGNEVWYKVYTFGIRGYCVQITDDGGFIVSGAGYCIMKTDNMGNRQWQNSCGGGINSGYQIQKCINGGYISIGTSYTNNTYSDFNILKIDSDGNKEWDRSFNESGNSSDFGYAIKQTNDGGYILCGTTSKFGDNDKDIWIVKVDASGFKQWDRIFGKYEADESTDIIQTADGGYLFTGYTQSFGTNNRNIWIIKTNANGYTESHSDWTK